jgi:hypothetical protein
VGIGDVINMQEKAASSVTFWLSVRTKGFVKGTTTFWSKRELFNAGLVTSVPADRLRKLKPKQ